jgi:uncharacterized membrane protein YfcA
MLVATLLVGLVAGALTTVTGAGGGVFFILAMSLFIGPHAALAASAPTLLVGNAHRLVLYRGQVEGRTARAVVAGALPASLIAGAMTVSLPAAALRVLLLLVVAYAVARAFGRLAWKPHRALFMPAGMLVGAVSATSGGAGLLVAPLLLSTGLTGKAYVGTSAAIALATHVGRLLGYGSRGLLTSEVLVIAAIATSAVVCGNFLGDRSRALLDARRTSLLEHGTLAVCGLLAVLGVTM